MREITEVIVHCSATPEGRDVSTETIRGWHTEGNGWSDIGYHCVVELDGKVCAGRDEERSGAHAKGHNKKSIGVCYVGGVDADQNPKDTRTDAQKESLKNLLKELIGRYPRAKIYGHRDFSDKACPSFDAKAEYADL